MEKPGFGLKIKIMSNAFDTAFTRRNASLEPTCSLSHLLGFIVRRREDPVCLQDLESFFNLRHSTVTGIIQRLEEKGFVTTSTDPADHRKRRVLPTEHSIELTHRMYDVRTELDEEMTEGISSREMAAFEQTLDKLLHNAARKG